MAEQTRTASRSRRGRAANARTRSFPGEPSAKPPLRTRLRYRFDSSLSRGPLVLIAWLAGFTLGVALLGALFLNLISATFGGSLNGTLPEDLWQSVLRTVDTGTFANDTQWPTRVIALMITLSGIFLAGSLIGIISAAIDQRVEHLRRGRSRVVEVGHTLVLGWSPRLPVIVRELVVANENVRDAAIVVLAQRDKTEMEQELRERVPDTETTKVVCRTGDPSKPDDLQRVNIAAAKSVIVLDDENNEGDAGVVKAVLAVKTLDPNFEHAHVVAELGHNDNAATLRAVTDGRVLTLNSDHVIAEVTAQACHQAGLAYAFQDLLDFEGDEIYICPVRELMGHTYAEALMAFEHCAVIGRFTGDEVVELNPDPGVVFGADDQVIVVAEDDDKVVFDHFRSVPAPTAAEEGDSVVRATRVLVCGWSSFGPKVLREVDEFLTPGSDIEVFVRADLVDLDEVRSTVLENASLHVHVAEGGPEQLLRLEDGEPFDDIIVLGYRNGLSIADADAYTLLTLLTLRKVWPEGGPDDTHIVAELLDQANVAIASTTGADDFIVSDALTSLMIAQLSERAELQAVFDDLFDPQGAVLELRRAPTLVPDEPISYATVVAACAAHGASALGYRLAETGQVVINPAKSTTVHLSTDDEVLVVGLRET